MPFSTQKPSMVSRVSEALKLAAEDDNVKGLILRIRSPGGGVSASETMYHMLSKWREKTGRPVVAYFQGLATSGAYYLAMSSNEVIAHPSSVTGSIGVVMPGINIAGLMEQFGVSNQTLTSGKYKDSGSMLRPMRDDERAVLQGVVDDLYGRFVDVVDQGRPNLDAEAVKKAADGRVYSANQALALGLVDQIGHLEEAIERAEALAGIDDSEIIMYRTEGDLTTNLYSQYETTPKSSSVDIDLIPVGDAKLPAGFYYLWPLAVPR
jgi:protease-4